MMLALETMDPGWQALFYGLAVALFVVGTILTWAVHPRQIPWVLLFGGLTFVTFVQFYEVLARA